MNTYKLHGRTLSGKDLLSLVDWERVTQTFATLKARMDSLSYQPPEVVVETYSGLVDGVNSFAKELLLFDRTEVYRKALEDIVAHYGSIGNEHERAYTLAKAALESIPAPTEIDGLTEAEAKVLCSHSSALFGGSPLIHTIKALRERTGCSLAEAKNTCELFIAKHCEQHPSWRQYKLRDPRLFSGG